MKVKEITRFRELYVFIRKILELHKIKWNCKARQGSVFVIPLYEPVLALSSSVIQIVASTGDILTRDETRFGFTAFFNK